MSLFNQIINGINTSNLVWSVTRIIGDVEFDCMNYCKTYAEALAFKVNQPKSQEITIELFLYPNAGTPELIADETNWSNVKDSLIAYENEIINKVNSIQCSKCDHVETYEDEESMFQGEMWVLADDSIVCDSCLNK